MSKIMILKNISKSFKNKEILKNVNISFENNKITGIIGRNGSGKTVLLKIIVGLYFPDNGTIELKNNLSIDEDFGVLIDNGFLDNESGFKNLKMISLFKNRINDVEICEVMKLVGLDPVNKTKYKNYSTGMKQKLKIAQALMEKPKLLVLDEPFNGLDQESVYNFRKLFLKLKQDGTTIIITSHYREDIDELCDYVYKMENGEMVNYEKDSK